MPTPYGSRGGMAFGTEELRVLRRALALALQPGPASAEDVQDCFRLAESLDEALAEAARLRAFLLADLGRYRAALPATATGYLSLLAEALDTGHRPTPDDVAALRALSGNPRAATLLAHCRGVPVQQQGPHTSRMTAGVPSPTVPADASATPKAPTSAGTASSTLPAPAPATSASEVPAPAAPARRAPSPALSTPALAVPAVLVSSSVLPASAAPVPGVPAAAILASELPASALVPAVIELPVSRTRLLALPGGAADPAKPGRKPGTPAPERPATEPEQPKRPVPTPGEVFPPRKPTAPPDPTSEQLAAG
ncbi:hypothetical protein [Streptomyces sp. NPDC059597]|uniref:hypothetical protein n=1 Tax=Streptomyces sp. NPDC059597 TaxID=3346879 RepID=UPI0036856B95